MSTTATKSTTAHIELKDGTTDLAKKFKGKIEIDAKTGLAKVDKDFYVENLPEGLTVEAVKAVADYNTDFAAAATLAVGDAAIPFLKKHHNHHRVAVTIPAVGKDAFEVDFKRSIKTTNPNTKEEGVKYGAVSVKFDFYGTTSRGELNKVKAHLSEKAAKALAD